MANFENYSVFDWSQFQPMLKLQKLKSHITMIKIPSLILSTILLGLFFTLSDSSAAEPDPKSETFFLDQLTSSYQKAVDRRSEEFEKEATLLRTRYLGALEKLQNFYQAGGDIDGAVIVKKERERVLTTEGLGEPVQESSKFEKLEKARLTFERSAGPLRTKFEEELASLAEIRNSALERHITEVTKSGDLEKAVALKQQLDKWHGERAYLTSMIPENARELISYLTNTTWTYVNSGKPQYMRFYPEEVITTMWQEDLNRTFGKHDYRITPGLDVIWEYGGEEIRMEFDDEFLSYKSFMHKADKPHRVGEFLHRGPELLPK